MRGGAFIRAVTALLFRTIAEGTLLLRGFLEQERRLALRAGFADRLVPIHGLALRIIGAAVKDFTAPGFFDHDLAATTRPRTLYAGGFLLDVLALRIV